MQKTQRHIEEIKNLLNNFVIESHNNNLKGDGNWTHGIKNKLYDLGSIEEYNICSTGFKDERNGEWLYDMVWYKEEGLDNDKRLTEVALVVESEWNCRFDDIKYDFEKLLVTNAGLRLMICQTTVQNIDNLMNYFKDAICKYKMGNKGDTFLTAILDKEEEKFYFEVITR